MVFFFTVQFLLRTVSPEPHKIQAHISYYFYRIIFTLQFTFHLKHLSSKYLRRQGHIVIFLHPSSNVAAPPKNVTEIKVTASYCSPNIPTHIVSPQNIPSRIIPSQNIPEALEVAFHHTTPHHTTFSLRQQQYNAAIRISRGPKTE